MTLERWVDFSKWQGNVSDASLRLMKADGIIGVCVGSWHGIDANPYVRSVLSRARNNIGLDTATYFVMNNRPGRETVERAIAACGQEVWDRCLFHAPDVEIRGITEAILRDGINATKAADGLPIIYTGNWFWNWWRSALGHAPDFRDLPSWIAVYNGRPDLSVTPAPGLGPMMIHQYTGSTKAYGTTVDFNVGDVAWMDTARRRLLPSPPVPAPEPEPPAPPEEEDLMGKIKDIMARAGAEIEAEIAIAKKLPVPIKGDTGKTGKTGATGAPGAPGPAGGGTAPAGRTYTVKAGDSLGAIANKYSGVTWQQIYEANKATIGSNPNLIQPGMVLVIP